MDNREIKFRAWDKNKNCFIPNDVWAVLTTDCSAFGIMLRDWENYREGEYFYKESQELMRYTGLKDKNGKEIYEGDIVRSDGSMDFSTPTAQSKSVREIYKMPSGFTGVRINNQFDKSIFSSASNWSNYTLFNIRGSLEIIGNIFENPELLGE